MSIYKILQSIFAPKPIPAPNGKNTPGVTFDGIKGRCIRHLVSHKKIDAWTIQKMGSTDARKIISDLRKAGYLRPFDGEKPAFEQVHNAKGKGTHRVHFWSGKVPAEWAKKA